LDRQKNAAIPAIRASVNGKIIRKLAFFRHFRGVFPRLLCQVALFHFREKTALASEAIGFQKHSSGRESASGA
jgi:hypothetical protein